MGVYWAFVATKELVVPPPPRPSAQPVPVAVAPVSLPGKLVGKAEEVLDARADSGADSVEEMLEGRIPPDQNAEAVVAGAAEENVLAEKVPSIEAETIEPVGIAIEEMERTSLRPPPSDLFQAWVGEARISGVFQGSPSRALINGKTYREGALIDAELGITFARVDPVEKIVIFRDARGALVGKKY